MSALGVQIAKSLLAPRMHHENSWGDRCPENLTTLATLAHLTRVDRKLARMIAKLGECCLQMETTQDIFEELLDSIISRSA
jgi:3-methyladenine DNA glycosylase/8-oxoguanine DNA glycosylase